MCKLGCAGLRCDFCLLPILHCCRRMFVAVGHTGRSSASSIARFVELAGGTTHCRRAPGCCWIGGVWRFLSFSPSPPLFFFLFLLLSSASFVPFLIQREDHPS